jgi:hypothetical protein
VAIDSDATRLAKQLVAGTFAGMAQVMVGHPLDTIKVKSIFFSIICLLANPVITYDESYGMIRV